MAINLSPYKATDRASADIFNEKQMDIQTHLNNLQEQIKTLTQQLNNKVEYFDNTMDNPELTEKVKNPICVRPYIMTINEPVRQALGIPSTTGMYWGNIICLPNPNGSGYAFQIFCSMVSGTILKRFAHAHNWGSWT